MAASPIVEEISGGPAGVMIAGLAGLHEAVGGPTQEEAVQRSGPTRHLAIYPASAGFDLVDELDYLCTRTIEPNVFFNPRFLAPAMPRLEDREVRLAVIRDGDGHRSRLRLLVPFSVERPASPLGVAIMRTWANPFGPLGTPLLDRDDPHGVLGDFFTMLARPHLKLPKILALPDLRVDGDVASVLTSFADTNGLPITITDVVERPMLHSDLDGETYLKQSLRGHHLREFKRLKRKLEQTVPVTHEVARSADEIRTSVETFLTLEASGWKGRRRTAMAVDRYRAAFAREAVHRLAEQDMCRIHTLSVGAEAIASLIVFIERGVAYTWKTAYDERYSAYSPGTLLMLEATRLHLEDPNIMMTDSCAVPDHPVMSRLWSERRSMGTLVIGLTPGVDRAVRQAASQLHLYRETRNLARLVRRRMRALLNR